MAAINVSGETLQRTTDLVLRKAASNLVLIEWYADLDVEAADAVTPLRVMHSGTVRTVLQKQNLSNQGPV